VQIDGVMCLFISNEWFVRSFISSVFRRVRVRLGLGSGLGFGLELGLGRKVYYSLCIVFVVVLVLCECYWVLFWSIPCVWYSSVCFV